MTDSWDTMIEKDDTELVAEASGYSAGSGNFNNLLGQLRTLCVIDYPRTGEVEITDWAAQVLG